MKTLALSRLKLAPLIAAAVAAASVSQVGCRDGGGSGAGGKGGGGAVGTGGLGAGGTGGGTGGGAGTTVDAGGGAAGTAGGGGTAATGGGGGGACVETNPPAASVTACMSCLAEQSNPATDGCCPLAATDPTGYALCQAASACMRAGGPPTGVCNVGGDITTCYCGPDLSTCSAGGANGPCVVQVSAAAGRNVLTMTNDSPAAPEILARQGNPTYAIGRAANIEMVGAVFCPTECAF